MADETTSQQYIAEISMLKNEICDLTRELDENLRELNDCKRTKKNDPFRNPTEYHHYTKDYSDILPLAGSEGFEIPLEPSAQETKKLRRFYSIGGWSMLIHLLLSTVLSTLITTVAVYVIMALNPSITNELALEYVNNSSILVAGTMLTYLITNTSVALIGLGWSKTDFFSNFRTNDFGFGKILKYGFCGIFIQAAAAEITRLADLFFGSFGYDIDTMNDSVFGSTDSGTIIMYLYFCIIAPLTEELLYRGMLLRVFSRASQRFGIFASAFFFGVAHGNIQQFVLAFLFGIFLAHIDMKHNSIIPSIFAHIFLNTVSTVSNELSEHFGTSAEMILNYVYIGMAVIGAACFISFVITDKLPATTPHQSRRGLSVAAISLPFLSAVTVYIFVIIAMIVLNSPNPGVIIH